MSASVQRCLAVISLFDSLYTPLNEAIRSRIPGGAGGMLKILVFGEVPEVSTVMLRTAVGHDFAGKQLFELSNDCAAAGIACQASYEGHFGIIVIDNQIVLSV